MRGLETAAVTDGVTATVTATVALALAGGLILSGVWVGATY